jgi:hypothetical protein
MPVIALSVGGFLIVSFLRDQSRISVAPSKQPEAAGVIA